MNAREIEIFRTVMRCRSLSAAARVLNVSQPALSKAVRHCEDRLGFALFQRKAGRLVPTAQADELLPAVDRIFRDLQALKALAHDLGVGRGGLLRVGATSSLSISIVPTAIASLKRAHPAARVTLHLLPLAELAEALTARRIDIGLALTPLALPGIESKVLGTTTCMVVLPAGHALAGHTRLGPRDLGGQCEIGFGSWQDFGRSLDDVFAVEGTVRNVGIEIGTSVNAIALVREGAGIAIVDGLAASVLPPGLVARQFVPELTRQIVAAKPDGLGTMPLADDFMRALLEILGRPTPAGGQALG